MAFTDVLRIMSELTKHSRQGSFIIRSNIHVYEET
jgi:hypothetical protein